MHILDRPEIVERSCVLPSVLFADQTNLWDGPAAPSHP